MQIRHGTAANHEAVLEVYRRAEQPAPDPIRLARVATKLREELLVVADDDGDILGFALGEAERAERGRGQPVPAAMHLSMVFVAPSRQREGVGRALVEGLANAGWAQGYRTVSLWSSTPEFWETCGVERTDETKLLTDGRTAVRLTAELEAPVREITLDGAGIRLGQLLKFAGLVDTGADAKVVLAAEGVEVNGEVETRRGRQLHDRDEVRTQGEAVVVRLTEA